MPTFGRRRTGWSGRGHGTEKGIPYGKEVFTSSEGPPSYRLLTSGEIAFASRVPARGRISDPTTRLRGRAILRSPGLRVSRPWCVAVCYACYCVALSLATDTVNILAVRKTRNGTATRGCLLLATRTGPVDRYSGRGIRPPHPGLRLIGAANILIAPFGEVREGESLAHGRGRNGRRLFRRSLASRLRRAPTSTGWP